MTGVQTCALPICADKHRIVQVLSNLVGNALKFTPSGGAVRLSVTKRDDDLLFCVSDTGPGIAAGQVESIFHRFWRSDTGHQKGLGLGLFIAKGIVEAHGGRIWCESKPGEGASFLFTLPSCASLESTETGLSNGERAQPARQSSPSPAPALAWTALLADDDDDIRSLLSRGLQRAGFTVREYKNGADLVSAFRAHEHQTSLVVSDIGMPELDGIAAVSQIRAMSPSQPILMVTAFTDLPTLQRAQGAGANRVLYKPLNLAAFVAAAVDCVGAPP